MESWIIRQAHANMYSPHLFTLAFLRQGVFTVDFDACDPSSDVFRLLSSLLGAKRATAMTFQAFVHISNPNLAQRLFWKSKEVYHGRFCPLCLAEDKVPYLRLEWRLQIVPICVRHGVLLEERCGKCHTKLRPTFRNDSFDIGTCGKCGSNLSRTPVTRIGDADPAGLEAMKEILHALCGRTQYAGDFKAKLSEEKLDRLYFLARFIRYLHAKRVLSSGDPSASQQNTEQLFKSPKESYRFVAEAWSLVWNEANLETFIREHQSLFNDFDRDARPKSLRDYWMPYEVSKEHELEQRLRELVDGGYYPSLDAVVQLRGFDTHARYAQAPVRKAQAAFETLNTKERKAVVGRIRRLAKALSPLQRADFTYFAKKTGTSRGLLSNDSEVRRTVNSRARVSQDKWLRQSSRFSRRIEDLTFWTLTRLNSIDRPLTRERLDKAIDAAWNRFIISRDESYRKQLRNVIEALPVSFPLNAAFLTRQLGLAGYRLQKDPLSARMIKEAQRNTLRFYESFRCPNPRCVRHHSPFHGLIRRRIRPRWIRLSKRTTTSLRCWSCGTTFFVSTRNAPKQRL